MAAAPPIPKLPGYTAYVPVSEAATEHVKLGHARTGSVRVTKPRNYSAKLVYLMIACRLATLELDHLQQGVSRTQANDGARVPRRAPSDACSLRQEVTNVAQRARRSTT